MRISNQKIVLITGPGRGKTSNAIGRIYEHLVNKREVIIVQFMKTGKNCGECSFLQAHFNIPWFYAGRIGFVRHEKDKTGYHDLINSVLKEVENFLHNKGTVDILLLDELAVALGMNLVSWEDVVPLISYVKGEIIITGRIVNKLLKDKAETIIAIDEIKHPYQKHITARKGIDY